MSEEESYRPLRGRNYLNAKTFDEMSPAIYHDPAQGITIRGGNIFECRTVKGHTNLIVVWRIIQDRMGTQWMVYSHADKMRRTPLRDFIRAVQNGEIEPKKAKEIDTNRLDMATIGFDAVVNRRTGEEQIQCLGEFAEEKFLKGVA